MIIINKLSKRVIFESLKEIIIKAMTECFI